MTLKEATKRLGKSENTIRRYIQQGKLEATLVDRKYDISEDSLSEYLNRYGSGDLDNKEEEIVHLRNLITQMSTQIVKLQDELIENQRRADEARQRTDQITQQLQSDAESAKERSDTIILQLTQQVEQLTNQNQLLLEDLRPKRRWYHRLLAWNGG